MDEKKVKAPKKISIKNKKDATRTLAKSTIKGKTTSNKKNTSVKKTSSKIEKKNEIKTPNNIVRKIENTKGNKDIAKEKVKNKDNIKTKEKVKTKTKIKETSKTKITLPKEWKVINQKNKEKVNGSKTRPLTDTQGFKGKLRSSIFEEVDEKELIEQKKKGREKLKKNLIILLIVIIVLAVIVIALLKYNDFVKKQLAVYDVYKIGDKVELNDGTIWYVVKDSDSKESTITLLDDALLDTNQDGIVNDSDKYPYNTDNKAEYNIENENSVANFLNKTYKEKLNSLGKISEVRLLTSKEYVKIRERMGFGYEWTNNWLAGPTNFRWWIESSQNDKVFIVKSSGTYTLVSPTTSNYVRIVIKIDKDSVKLVEEQRKMRVDLTKGLNN